MIEKPHPNEIVDERNLRIWNVQRHAATVTLHGATVRNMQGALLGGLLRCSACDAAMVHSWTRRQGRLHRYYVCGKAQKRGWSTCPTKSVSATEIETFVVDQIRGTSPGTFQDQQASRALAAPIWEVLLTPEK